jgi:hypothetical protein
MKIIVCFAVGLSLALSLTGCKDKSKDASGPAASGTASPKSGQNITSAAVIDPAAMIPAGLPDAFTAWDLPARAKAWQGARLTQPSIGFKIAIDVAGKTITTWDGKTEKALELEMESPCSMKIVENMAGGQSSTTTHYTMRSGKLLQGLGDAGSRNGKTAVACISNAIFTVDDTGACTQWTANFGKFERAKSTCGFAQKAGKEVFTASVNGMDVALIVDGDAMFSEQLGNANAQSFADFAAAKAARDAK